MGFLDWEDHINSLEKLEGWHALEKQQAREALEYLQRVLGDDFLARSRERVPCIGHHPMLAKLSNFAPSSRRDLTRFAEYLRALEDSQNLGKVLARLHDAVQFNHDELLIKLAAKLVWQGLRASFEPTMPVADNQKQPDLKLQDPLTGETLFLEVVTQPASRREREAMDTNSAVFNSVFGVSFDACCSGRWYRIPSKQVLEDILQRTTEGVRRALSERTVVFIREKETLEMALCHRDDKARLLDPWSKERGLVSGFLGPPFSRNDAVRLKRKMRREQEQLPHNHANVIVILDSDAFIGTGGVRRVMREVEEAVFKNDHVHLVIVHGECIDSRAVPFEGHDGYHRYVRRIIDGTTENDLLLLNTLSRTTLSANMLAKFHRLF